MDQAFLVLTHCRLKTKTPKVYYFANTNSAELTLEELSVLSMRKKWALNPLILYLLPVLLEITR